MKQLLLLFPTKRRRRAKVVAAPPSPEGAEATQAIAENEVAVPPTRSSAPPARPTSKVRMQDRYDQLVIEMKTRYGFRIRKWRQSMSGCAWMVKYEDGKVVRLIESPYPRGPMSAAIFLHEVGHHAIGFGVYKPRCLEELRAWEWSLQAMATHGLNITPRVHARMQESMRYAVAKALRRGLKRLPADLVPYLPESATTAPA